MPLTFGVHTGQQNCSLEELRRVWPANRSRLDQHTDHFYEAPPIDGRMTQTN
jgi:hypothetical protein